MWLLCVPAAPLTHDSVNTGRHLAQGHSTDGSTITEESWRAVRRPGLLGVCERKHWYRFGAEHAAEQFYFAECFPYQFQIRGIGSAQSSYMIMELLMNYRDGLNGVIIQYGDSRSRLLLTSS